MQLLLRCQARGHLGRRSSATGTVGRRGRLERGHPGRSVIKAGGAWQGLISGGTVPEL